MGGRSLGEGVACGLVNEAVLRQILQHLLTIHSKDEGDHVLLLAEEQLKHSWRKRHLELTSPPCSDQGSMQILPPWKVTM